MRTSRIPEALARLHDAQAAGALVRTYRPGADQDLEIARMRASIPLIHTGEDTIGWMGPEIWAGMERTLRQQRVLTAPVRPDDVYTLRFLEATRGGHPAPGASR